MALCRHLTPAYHSPRHAAFRHFRHADMPCHDSCYAMLLLLTLQFRCFHCYFRHFRCSSLSPLDCRRFAIDTLYYDTLSPFRFIRFSSPDDISLRQILFHVSPATLLRRFLLTLLLPLLRCRMLSPPYAIRAAILRCWRFFVAAAYDDMLHVMLMPCLLLL